MKIYIIYTGGTIGCCGNPLTPLSAHQFIRAFSEQITPLINQQYLACHLKFTAFEPSLDSTHLQPSDWCLIANFILQNYTDYDAFIVLHGTDSMAWSASAVSFLLTGLNENGQPNTHLSKPVIFTGAQLPLFYEKKHYNGNSSFSILYNTDAVQNILGSITCAYTMAIADVFIYFNHTLLQANRTIKTNANDFNAFSSPNFPILGKQGINFTEYKIKQQFSPLIFRDSLSCLSARTRVINQLQHISKNIDQATVLPFSAYPASYDCEQKTSIIATMLESCINQGIKGLILESYGTGNFPSGNPITPEEGAIYKVLTLAHRQGIIIINSSQVLQATVNANSYTAGSWLAQIGAIGVADMTAITAFCKLTYLISLKDFHDKIWTQSTLEKLMSSNLIGEVQA